MKKILALILALATLFALASCGSAPSEDEIRGDQYENNETAEVETAGEANEETDTDVAATEEKEFSIGSAKGTVYESKFIGLGCKFPDGWTFYNDEQMKELNQQSADLLGDDYLEALEKASVVQDMFATSADSLSNMTVALEKVSALQLATLDVGKNFEAIVPTLLQTYTNAGISDVTYEVSSVTIEGKTFDTLEIKANTGVITLYQTMIGVKCNGYLATIGLTSSSQNTIQKLLDCFYLVK